MLTPDEYRLLIGAGSKLQKLRTLVRSAARGSLLRRSENLLLVHRLLLLTPVPGIDPPRSLDIYDFDDALHIGSAGASNRRFQWTKQEARRSTVSMARARLVIAANPTLADFARRHNGRVEIVPSCVDPDSQPLHAHADGPLTVGWIGSHTTVSYLAPLLPVIARLSGLGQAIRLVVVGADTGVREPWIEHRGWSPETQADDLASFDVGVMPLPDTPWTQGKAGYKILQYFAAGVPAIASPVGVNRSMVAEGRGIAATSPEEWEAALLEMLDSSTARAERGRAARQYVKQNYSYQRWAPELATLFQSLAR
jgi:glycosyltransferase involved in cell wall biosynthesis